MSANFDPTQTTVPVDFGLFANGVPVSGQSPTVAFYDISGKILDHSTSTFVTQGTEVSGTASLTEIGSGLGVYQYDFTWGDFGLSAPFTLTCYFDVTIPSGYSVDFTSAETHNAVEQLNITKDENRPFSLALE